MQCAMKQITVWNGYAWPMFTFSEFDQPAQSADFFLMACYLIDVAHEVTQLT